MKQVLSVTGLQTLYFSKNEPKKKKMEHPNHSDHEKKEPLRSKRVEGGGREDERELVSCYRSRRVPLDSNIETTFSLSQGSATHGGAQRS